MPRLEVIRRKLVDRRRLLRCLIVLLVLNCEVARLLPVLQGNLRPHFFVAKWGPWMLLNGSGGSVEEQLLLLV
jgi:hypothetical protein